MEAAFNQYVINPLATIDKYVHDHVDLKKYQNYSVITRLVNAALALTFSLSLFTLKRVTHIISNSSIGITAVALTALLELTTNRRILKNEGSSTSAAPAPLSRAPISADVPRFPTSSPAALPSKNPYVFFFQQKTFKVDLNQNWAEVLMAANIYCFELNIKKY